MSNRPRYTEEQLKRYRATRKITIANRLKTDMGFRLSQNISIRITFALDGIKRVGTVKELLGCSLQAFMAHMEAQFTDGMTWENYGIKGWHIDHIKPCASFDFAKEEEQRKCFHYTNCQPLWARDNLKKNCNWTEIEQQAEKINSPLKKKLEALKTAAFK